MAGLRAKLIGAGTSAPPGFTLLEVLVAFAIAAPALILLFGQGASSVGVAQTASMNAEAISRAQSRIAGLSDASLHAGEQSGDDGGGYTWRMMVAPLGNSPPLHTAREGTAYAGGATLYAVTVSITWPSGAADGGVRAVTLATRRIGPSGGRSP